MSAEIPTSRPNIRIQILNNVSEDSVKMDVDGDENEEGEINDDDNERISENVDNSAMKKVTAGIFTTGINIFDRKGQDKLQERAKRFALKPEEIHSFTDQDLQDLYDSLGINSSNHSEIKFETIHLLGLDEMSAEDVLDYFTGYAPDGIEWLDENSCNVVWLDSISAARALHFKSKSVRSMPVRQAKDVFPREFLDDVEEPEKQTGQSILLKNKNREIELQNEIGEVITPKEKNFLKNSVDISEITIPIPPGYWRLGIPHEKSKCLLVRYGLISDKLPFKSEKCSRYYKKLVNPVISESKKKELRSIFERNKELNQDKNPWGSLARNWDSDAKFREREPVVYVSDNDEPVIEIKNPKLLARLGTKRKLDAAVEENKSEENRESKKKRNKVPRMKMYADEEEENMKRKKLLQKIKEQTENIEKNTNEKDLRSMLGPTNRLVTKKDLLESSSTIDLGTRLKNRNQKMIFAIERDLFNPVPPVEYLTREVYPDVREQLIERSRERHKARERSPPSHRTREERHERQPLERSRRRRRRSQEVSHRSSRKRSSERTLHSDHLHTHSIRRRANYSSGDRSGHKPRSKVAVVIRTQKKPTVASTIWSKVRKSSESEQSSTESDSDTEESEKSSSSSESDSESESDSSSGSSRRRARNPDRPGFDKNRLSRKLDHKSPLKITMANDHYKRRK